MKKIKNFKDFKAFTNLSDLYKINLIATSDKFSFSHVDHIVKSVASMLFTFIMPPGIFEDTIISSYPVYNYGNNDEIHALIKSGVFKRKNIYNVPGNLENANDKVKFHKKMEGCPFVPKTVFTPEDAKKLKFPLIAKPKNGSK